MGARLEGVFIRDIFSSLARSGVGYCVVGGVAVNLHGIPRMTYDIDLVVTPTAEALGAVEELLTGMGLRCRLPVRLADFADPEYRQRMHDERNLVAVTFTDPADPLREVDILVAPPVDARALVERSIALDLDGTTVRVVAFDDLIALKRAGGRPQDLADLALLERIRGDGNV